MAHLYFKLYEGQQEEYNMDSLILNIPWHPWLAAE
jgi:hypothetical protein